MESSLFVGGFSRTGDSFPRHWRAFEKQGITTEFTENTEVANLNFTVKAVVEIQFN